MPAFSVSYGFVTVAADQADVLKRTGVLQAVCKAVGFDPGMAKVSQPLPPEEIARLRLDHLVERAARERFGAEASPHELDSARAAMVELADGNVEVARLLVDAVTHRAGAMPKMVALALTDAARAYSVAHPTPLPATSPVEEASA